MKTVSLTLVGNSGHATFCGPFHVRGEIEKFLEKLSDDSSLSSDGVFSFAFPNLEDFFIVRVDGVPEVNSWPQGIDPGTDILLIAIPGGDAPMLKGETLFRSVEAVFPQIAASFRGDYSGKNDNFRPGNILTLQVETLNTKPIAASCDESLVERQQRVISQKAESINEGVTSSSSEPKVDSAPFFKEEGDEEIERLEDREVNSCSTLLQRQNTGAGILVTGNVTQENGVAESVEATTIEAEKCAVKTLNYPTEEENREDPMGTSCLLVGNRLRPVQKALQLMILYSLYMMPDGKFHSDDFYIKNTSPGTVIYSDCEEVDEINLSEISPMKAEHCRHKLYKWKDTYILKLAEFMKRNLDIWKLLFHDNIQRLNGVIWKSSHSQDVYQVTSSMTGDLHMATKSISVLETLRCSSRWTTAWINLWHIFWCITNGVCHLQDRGYQHYDIKEHNILVGKPSGCHCDDLIGCICGIQKWKVRITDFDTIDEILNPLSRNLGTSLYRPPEYCAMVQRSFQYQRPTYDTWSIMITFLHVCLGKSIVDNAIREANIMAGRRGNKRDKKMENYYALILLKKLSSLARDHPNLLPVAKLADECLVIDHNQRPTAAQLLPRWKE